MNPEFPKWKYHKSEPAVVVGNARAEYLLGPGWFDSPDLRPSADELAKTAAVERVVAKLRALQEQGLIRS